MQYNHSANAFDYIKHKVLLYNSKINDAITTDDGTFVTGSKGSGISQYMFFYQFSNKGYCVLRCYCKQKRCRKCNCC